MNRFIKVVTVLVLVVGIGSECDAGPEEDKIAISLKRLHEKNISTLRPLGEQGDAGAQHYLGMFYEGGQLAPPDYAEALKWYKKAADQGFDEAQNSLGLMYKEGNGVSQDYNEAVNWFRKAADQGLSLAQYNLAFMYLGGLGVPQDYTLSHMWLNLAAAGGQKEAVAARNALNQQMTPEQITEAQKLAREWKPKTAIP